MEIEVSTARIFRLVYFRAIEKKHATYPVTVIHKAYGSDTKASLAKEHALGLNLRGTQPASNAAIVIVA